MLRPQTAFVLAAALFVPALAAGQPPAAKKDKKDKLVLSAAEQGVIDATNAERKKAGLGPLKANPKLMEAARKHAVNMAKQDKLEHDLDGKSPTDRIKAAGYPGRKTGENIAWNPRSPAAAVEGWMNSPPHKENILTKEYTEIGVGLATSANGEPYWVQVFGNPR
jgi:uncharacterized protein YkwD